MMADRSVRWWNACWTPLRELGIETPIGSDHGLCAIGEPVETREGWGKTADGNVQRGVLVTAFIPLPGEPAKPFTMDDYLDAIRAARHPGALEALAEQIKHGKVVG